MGLSCLLPKIAVGFKGNSYRLRPDYRIECLMASSLSRSSFRTFLLNSPILKPPNFCSSFCTNSLSSSKTSDSEDALVDLGDDSDPISSSSPSSGSTGERRAVVDPQLEDGVDIGIYKAILVGQVKQPPIQKKLRNGRTVTLLSLGTGGIRNNRRPMDNEDPKEYANRSAIQWHRVSVYPARLGELALKNVVPGSVLYVEGNLETKVFSDPTTGLVRRLREVSIRANGRLVFLGKGSDVQESS